LSNEAREKHGAVGVLSADEELQQAVCAALIEARELDSRGIGVSAQSGTVVLTGRVRSREEWLRALRIARDQSGVSAVRTEGLSIDDS
jgi:osmotically-inducible protein OsmY